MIVPMHFSEQPAPSISPLKQACLQPRRPFTKTEGLLRLRSFARIRPLFQFHTFALTSERNASYKDSSGKMRVSSFLEIAHSFCGCISVLDRLRSASEV
jgi:hypothetical protein